LPDRTAGAVCPASDAIVVEPGSICPVVTFIGAGDLYLGGVPPPKKNLTVWSWIALRKEAKATDEPTLLCKAHQWAVFLSHDLTYASPVSSMHFLMWVANSVTIKVIHYGSGFAQRH
jgi:hypothetical protein